MHTHDPDRITSDAARTQAMRALIDAEHFRYRRFGSGEPVADEVLLTPAWGLVLETESTPAAERMVADFRSFCTRCLELSFSDGPGPALTWRTTGDDPASKTTDRQDPSGESFTLMVQDDAVVIEAGHHRGLLHGTHYLERLMADRGAPILEKQRIERTPLFTPRITNSIFIDAQQDVGDPSPFSDKYLGLMSHFGGNGVHGSPPEELQYHATWNPERSTDDLLLRIASRDFELDEAQARQVVQGWERLSDAWDDLPYSALLCGERAFYMRGPMYLGPAHPLIVNPQNDYGLGSKFRDLRADIEESRTLEEAAAEARSAPPRYIDFLMMAMPYGEDRFCELLARCREQWEAGLVTLRSVLESAGTQRAQMELDVYETVGIHLAAVDHVARFYRVRDRLWRDRIDRDQLVDAFAPLAEIARAEIESARRILPILDRDPRIAYNHCYRNPYDKEMVRAKIRQCEWVVDTELPRLSRELRFHLWLEFP